MRERGYRKAGAVVGAMLAGALLVGALGAGMTGAAAAPAATGEAPPGPGPEAFTVEAFTLEVLTGPDRDLAVTLDADLWVPESATAQTPAPAVLTSHGFGGHKATNEQQANAAYLASHGYVVLSYTAMGFGGSSSCIGLNSLDYDVPNAQAALDHLAALPFVALDAPGDPKVGLVGGSYGGGEQGLIAAVDGRVDAIAVGRSWNTLQYSLVPNDWVPAGADPWDLAATEQGVFKHLWTSLFFASGASEPAAGNGGCDPLTQQTEFPGQPPCPGFVPDICPAYARLSGTGDADPSDRDLVARSSVASVIDRLDTPTLLLQGQPDTLFTPTESAATYRGLRDRGVPTAMIWHSGGHGGYQTPAGEAEAYSGQWDRTPEAQAEFAEGYLPRRTLQWFERHVRGRAVDTGPAFAWFRDHAELPETGSAAPAFGTASDFPVPEATTTVLALDPATGALASDPATIGGGTDEIVSPPGGEPASYTEMPNFSSPGDTGDRPPFDPPGQAVSYTTEPFAAPVEIVGTPVLSLHVSHLAPTDLRLFAKLFDVAPDGSETLMRRMTAAARIPSAALDDTVLSAATDAAVAIRLPTIAWQLDTGHSLRLVLATTDQAYWNQRVADVVTITSDAATTSTLSLPLLGGVDRDETDPVPTGEEGDASEDDPTVGTDRTGTLSGRQLPATGGGWSLLVGGLLLAATSQRLRSGRRAHR